MEAQLSNTERKAFRTWLRANTELADRSISDVISRTSRVMGMINPLEAESDNELEFRLKERQAFVDCSVSVRSQLKRAARLYRRFVRESMTSEGSD